MIIYSGVTANNTSDTTAYLLTNSSECLVVVFHNGGQLLSVSSVKKQEIATHKWDSIYLGSSASHFTILPNISNETIPSEEITSFLNWKFDLPIFKNELQFDKNTLLFQDDVEAMQRLFPSIQVRHCCEWVINYAQKQTWQDGIACVTFLQQTIICVIKDQKLMLCNIFSVANNDELLYYLMLMFQEFSLSQEATMVHLFGECEATPILKTNLSNFVRNLETFEQSEIGDASISGIVKFLGQLA